MTHYDDNLSNRNRMINKLMAGINELHSENQQKQAEVLSSFRSLFVL